MQQPRRWHTSIVGFGLTLLVHAGCQSKPSKLDEPVTKATALTQPAHGAAAPAPGAVAPAADEVAGIVRETMDASEYTYARLERDGAQIWVAGPQTKLAIGTLIGPTPGTLMLDFHSSSLDRTFDRIYFISAFSVGGGPANPHAGAQPAASVTTAAEKIEPAAGGIAVAKVFADKSTLAGKPVVVRGKVTKVNNDIMGRNWLHLQDGTGAAGTNDLLITTLATAKVGDVVVARGRVAVDKDFGGGYRYAVLVEDATIASK